MNITKQVNRFWKVFESERINLENSIITNNIEEINEIKKILLTYFEELCNCTFSISYDGEYFEITFNSDGDKNAQYICALMKKMAPNNIRDKWIVNAFLPPLSDLALNTVIKLDNIQYTYHDFDVFYEVDKVNRLINIDLYSSAFNTIEPNKALEISLYLIRQFIGECEYEARVNHVNAIYELSDFENNCKLDELYNELLKIIEENKWIEYSDPTQIYMMYRLDEDIKVETVRKDMHLISTSNPLMIAETLNDEYFIANNFYDYGGEFGYLYYEVAHSKNDGVYRQQLDKSISELLYKHNIARSIGGAMGSKYAYIDLAIFDKDSFNKLLPKINEKLKLNLKYNRFE